MSGFLDDIGTGFTDFLTDVKGLFSDGNNFNTIPDTGMVGAGVIDGLVDNTKDNINDWMTSIPTLGDTGASTLFADGLANGGNSLATYGIPNSDIIGNSLSSVVPDTPFTDAYSITSALQTADPSVSLAGAYKGFTGGIKDFTKFLDKNSKGLGLIGSAYFGYQKNKNEKEKLGMLEQQNARYLAGADAELARNKHVNETLAKLYPTNNNNNSNVG